MGIRGYTLVLGMLAARSLNATDNSDRIFQVIRANDLRTLKNVDKADLESRDRRGATPLMHAAAYGSIDAVRLLLDARVDVNAKNAFGATALLWAARDGTKARLLIERGADVNAQSKQGRTPLMLASLRDGGAATVALMIAKGADVNLRDSRGDTALLLAAETGDIEIMRLLIAKGADLTARNQKGESALIQASKSRRPEAVRLLLRKELDVNSANTWYASVRHGQIQLLKLTALHHAAFSGVPEMVDDLIKAGANVNAKDVRGFSALTFSVAADDQNPAIVKRLLAAGADVNARALSGETPLDWAEKFEDPAVVGLLKEAGARHAMEYRAPQERHGRTAPPTALVRSIRLLQKSSAEFFKQSGCVGCHHQPLIAQAVRAARAAGMAVDEAAAAEERSQLKAQWASSQEEFLQAINPGGGTNRISENLLGLFAAESGPDTITDSAVVDLAESQAADGSWPAEAEARPPITESLIASTARAIRAIQVYSIPARKPEFDRRIERARAWLRQAKPVTTEDYSTRLLGLWWSGAEKPEIEAAARALLALQKGDGGWAGNSYLRSDAFATGKALSALHESQALEPRDERYQRGIDYLLATQYSDGSWYVRSRSIKFQPYFEGGFPFGADQWISAAATAWASMALAPAATAAAH